MPVEQSILEQLAKWRRIQATGQLLLSLGAVISFISYIHQLPLFEEQGRMTQDLERRVANLERRLK